MDVLGDAGKPGRRQRDDHPGPRWLRSALFHYTSVETFTSSKGSVTVSLAGVLDTEAEPEETVLKGYVIRGSWNGKNLAGASVSAKAHRVFADRSIFAGRVTITPSR